MSETHSHFNDNDKVTKEFYRWQIYLLAGAARLG